jgi:hypothetical protein
MRSEPSNQSTLIEPLDVQAAAAALCCRFGEPSAEARRLITLHELLGTSRALSRALEEFATAASAHYRGVHCTSDMRSDADRLTRALAAWSESVSTAGLTYRAWQSGSDLTSIGRALSDEPAVLTSYVGLADVKMQAPSAHPA